MSSDHIDRRYMSDDDGDDGDDSFSILEKIPHGINNKRHGRRSLTLDSNKENNDLIKMGPLTVSRSTSNNKAISKKCLMRSKANLDEKFRLIAEKNDHKTKRLLQDHADKEEEEEEEERQEEEDMDVEMLSQGDITKSGVIDVAEFEEEEGKRESEQNNEVEIGRAKMDQSEFFMDSRFEYSFEEGGTKFYRVEKGYYVDDNGKYWIEGKDGQLYLEEEQGEGKQENEDDSEYHQDFRRYAAKESHFEKTPSNQLSSYNSSRQSNSDDESYPRTPTENEIRTPLVSPGFSIKRRSLIGEVSAQRKLHKKNPEPEPSTIDAILNREYLMSARKRGILKGRTPKKTKSPSKVDIDNKENEGHDDISDNEQLTRIEEDSPISKGPGVTFLHSEKKVRATNRDKKMFNMTRKLFLKGSNAGTNKEADDSGVTFDNTDMFYSISSPAENSRRSSMASNNDDEDQVPTTPTRMTEAVAVSPRTEQVSRIIDDADISLDTSKPVNVETTVSPLSTHKPKMSPRKSKSPLKKLQETVVKLSAAKENRRDSLLGIADDEDEEILSELAKLVKETLAERNLEASRDDSEITFENPAEKPTFSIKQFAKIQSEYDEDLRVLKLELSNKNKELLKLSEAASASNLKIQDLEHQLDDLKLIEKQLQERNKFLTKEYEIFEKNVNVLQTDVISKDEKLASYTRLGDRFKNLYKEKQTELQKLRQEREQHLAEIEDLSNEKILLTNKVEFLQGKAIKMNNEIIVKDERIQEVETQLEELKEKHEAMDEENFGLKHQIDEINKQRADVTEKLNELKAGARQEQSMKNNLELSISELKESGGEMKRVLKGYEKEIESYKDDIRVRALENEQLIKESNEATEMVRHRDRKLNELENEYEKLKSKYLDALDEQKSKLAEINSINNKIGILNKTVSELTDRNNQLKIQVVKYKEELSDTKELMKYTQRDYDKLKDKYDDLRHDSADKQQQLSRYQQRLSHSEENYIEELEKIKHQVIVLQNTINSKDVELSHMEDNKMSLSVENDRLNEKLAGANDELSDARRQLTRLRSQQLESEKKTEERLKKLSDDLYVQYSQKHTNKVQILKEGYERKYSSEFNAVKSENESLKREVEAFKQQLENERKGKSELVKLWDKMVVMENAGDKL
ncbi:Slk19 protein [Saccharomycopsis crataegensis]|uniref:Slk19 protein n=1 Tax=Saccharomycopsis crataegensis TaxID=43959 RepID=A0AAV5QV96_9ASCO|nr:Slk19 protein [Saccharomycopsis crataegensis]